MKSRLRQDERVQPVEPEPIVTLTGLPDAVPTIVITGDEILSTTIEVRRDESVPPVEIEPMVKLTVLPDFRFRTKPSLTKTGSASRAGQIWAGESIAGILELCRILGKR